MITKDLISIILVGVHIPEHVRSAGDVEIVHL